MFGELLSDGDGSADVWFDGGYAGWRRGGGLVKEFVEYPDAAEDG